MSYRFAPIARAGQRGMALLMGLVMLVVMTLMAVVAINMTSTSVQVVGNAQFRQEAAAAGQKAIEKVISSPINAAKPADQFIDVNMDGQPEYKVTFGNPVCKYYKNVDTSTPGLPPECYGSVKNLCYWTVWELQATVTDISAGASGATVTVNQGVRTIAGLDAALIACGI